MVEAREGLNHRSVCRGNLVCPRCGRKMCEGCVTEDKKGEMKHGKGHKGECIICSGMWKEEDVILHPAKRKSEKKIGIYSERRYRLIRLEKNLPNEMPFL